MRTKLSGATALAFVLLIAPLAAAFEPLPRSTPAERQMDAGELARAFTAMQDLGYVKGMVVVRDGYVVGERHWLGPDTSLRDSRSVTKSVISILIGIAIEEGFIQGVGDPLVNYLPQELIPSDPAKHEITLGHLLTQTSGFEWNEEAEIVTWLESTTPTEDILNKPMAATPGTRWNYNTAATHLLSVAIAEATGMRTIEFADTYLFTALGITDRFWVLAGDYENGGAGLGLRTEDAAKLGVLFINGGEFGGERVVSRYWVNRTTYPDVHGIGRFGPLTDLQYGWLWWVDYGTDYNIYTAWGWGGQFVFCVPALKLVVATHAPWAVNSAIANRHEAAILDIIVNRILPATQDRRVLTTTGREVVELGAVDTMMQDFLRDYEIQGATAALVKDGRLVMARGYTLDEPEVAPLEPTALFRIGSIGKSITSVAVHQLIESGGLAHDTTVQSVLDVQPLPGEITDPLLDTITADHLLTHTSGIYTEDNIYVINDLVADATGESPPPGQDEIVSYIVGHPFVFAPENGWDYNNYGYMMLGMMLEETTGQGFVDYIQQNIFRPIGVSRVRQAHQLEIELAPTELSYDGLEGDPYRSPMEAGVSAGGLVMAAPDMARFFSELFDQPDAGGMLSSETRGSMLELPFEVSQIVGYGRGWFTEQFIDLIGVSLGALTDIDDGLVSYGSGGGGSGVHTFAIWRGDNTVFVLFSNHDPVAHDLIFPAIDIWPEHDLWRSVGISTEPVGPASTESWIPVVARAEGLGGSIWRSDVGLLNRSTLDNSIRLRHYQGGAYTDLELMLAPGAQSALFDVVDQLGLEGVGPLRVFSSEPLTVTSRTFNQTGDGTFGQFLPGVASEESLSTGDEIVLMQLQENATARTNIGLTNGWKRAARVAISLFDGAGEPVATIERTVPPEQTVQLNRPYLVQGGRTDISAGYAVIAVQSAESLFAYASVIDNASGDPTTVPAKEAPGAGHQWIAASAHAGGANNSQWRTDVAVLNLAGSEATVELRFHGDNGEIATQSLAVADGQQTVLTDVVDWLGREGEGAIEVASTQPVLLTSRTYNLGDAGSFGQFLDGEPAAAAAELGERRWLPQLAQNTAFRTNIGLLNTSANEARVRVRLFDGDGAELAVMGPTLSPGERRQIQEPYFHIAGRTDVDAGFITVEVRQGDGIFCYASVIDNGTNDPTTIPALE